MRKQVAIKLKEMADQVAIRYSKKSRAQNFSEDIFMVDEIIPLSAQGAMVIFKKNTGKKALAHFIHVDHPQNPFWQYYFVGAQHFINLHKLSEAYADVEKHNFKLNFK
jgi:hypothetical protein|tara:strand:- start:4767 stop:5090 length:324 start_codon:yes stop_codon:yes gene_type:complete